MGEEKPGVAFTNDERVWDPDFVGQPFYSALVNFFLNSHSFSE